MPRPTKAKNHIRAISNNWLWSSYERLMKAKPNVVGEFTDSEWASIPPAVYLYTDDKGVDVYVGQTSRKGKRIRSHVTKVNLRAGFGHRYQKHLLNREPPASNEQTKEAMKRLHLRWIEEPDSVRRRRLECLVIALNAPLCNGECVSKTE